MPAGRLGCDARLQSDEEGGAAAWDGLQVSGGWNQHLWPWSVLRSISLQNVSSWFPRSAMCHQDQQGETHFLCVTSCPDVYMWCPASASRGSHTWHFPLCPAEPGRGSAHLGASCRHLGEDHGVLCLPGHPVQPGQLWFEFWPCPARLHEGLLRSQPVLPGPGLQPRQRSHRLHHQACYHLPHRRSQPEGLRASHTGPVAPRWEQSRTSRVMGPALQVWGLQKTKCW